MASKAFYGGNKTGRDEDDGPTDEETVCNINRFYVTESVITRSAAAISSGLLSATTSVCPLAINS